MLGDVSQDFSHITDCSISQKEELSGVAIDDLSIDEISDSVEDFSATHISLHETDLLHCLFDIAFLVFSTFLEQVLESNAETQNVEIAVFRETPKEDL